MNIVKQLKGYAIPKFRFKKLLIDLEHIQSIDIGAICILLSVVEELSFYQVNVQGTFPNDYKCSQILKESGFLSHMKTITGSTFEIQNQKNLILKRGKNQTSNKEVGECIKKATQMLTGTSSHYSPIYSIIQEVNGNSVEHAYNEKEHWLLGMNYDESSAKVIFTFADNGFGILQTLYRKLGQNFFESVGLTSSEKVLRGVFLKKYSSRHRVQINRNKGLPLLKKIQDDGFVKNLMVISNDSYYYLETNRSYPLKVEYSGTFYYWELDLDCIKKWEEN